MIRLDEKLSENEKKISKLFESDCITHKNYK